VLAAGRAMPAGTQPHQATTALAQVAVLDTHAGPLADRGIVIAAFDHDPGGRQAAPRAYWTTSSGPGPLLHPG
jgi:hypothetical protein